MIDAMDSYHRRSASICCIPSLDSNNDVVEESASASDISDNDCRYLPPSTKTSSASADDGIYAKYKSSSSMVVKAGQHGLHAIASRDVKAGTVIVQCLPLAHSKLVPPGSNIMMDIDDDEDEEDEDSGRKKICTRCFVQEGDRNASSRKKKFGRCSKCKLVYYCCRSCQSEDWNEQHKLECQYYVKRRKQQSRNQLTMLHSNSAEEDALPLLLRTFNSLKYLREQGSAKGDSANEEVMPNDAGNNDEQEVGICVCGPNHFSSLMVSDSECFTSGSNNDSTALTLTKDLLESYAIRGSSPSSCKTKAVLDVFGYNKSNTDSDATQQELDTAYCIQRTLNAFQKNNFGIVNNLHTAIGEGVYPCAALLNHSCYPNCILRYKLGVGKAGDGSSSNQHQYHPPILQIVACLDITAGEELCHSYVDLALTTAERQARLLNTHGFECKCPQCTKSAGHLIKLPEDKDKWDLWPLTNGMTNGMQKYENNMNVDDKMPLEEVDIDDAITGSYGMNEAELLCIQHKGQLLQQKASQAMIEGDAEGELRYLQEAIDLFRPRQCGDKVWLSPFHSQLYTIRGSYLSALLANGNIIEAVHECEHMVSFLAVAFHNVKSHPLIGLQLYTLGDLYSGAVAMLDESATEEMESMMRKKAMLAYSWAKSVMEVSHGKTDPMVLALNDNR